MSRLIVLAVSGLTLAGVSLSAQAGARGAAPQGPSQAAVAGQPPAVTGVKTPAGYVIGPGDVLDVVFWKDEQSSSKDVPVRPDGKVSLTLLNEMDAAGLTPMEFRLAVTKAAEKFITDPVVSVNIKAINSRRVTITGNVSKPAAYSLAQPMTVVELISIAGGLQEYAKSKEIMILRPGKDGTQIPLKFNYKDVMKGKNLKQNIELQPGDQVIVP